jgi:CsoR family transcriptional regulator, copper-sensing transcriptional repressor
MAIRVRHNPGSTAGYAVDKTHLVARIHRIEGQVRGLAKMVENDEYCLDILTQINAVKGATSQLGLRLLEAHLKRGMEATHGVKIEELMLAVDRFSRS